jgi:DNA-directed RNA polymerase subunit F|nr:MAG TPA: Loader and inhibitor of phage G40P [Caudoviricetes sp.]
MNISEFSKEIKKIETAYNKEFNKDETIMWFQEFQNISAKEFGKAVDQIIKTNKFTPKIADIKAKISENTYRYYSEDPYRYLYKNLEWGEFID